jgi:hypothetical protein
VSAAAHALPRGELVLDRYRPLRPLGSGGSGSVWLARDERNGLDVALKIVPREGKAAQRAEREAEAAARLRHERCLRAYGFGSDSGHVYIAYEYVGGRTLREAIRAGELTDADAIEAAAQILEGLAHAHARGIVHRDVKPSNVLLAASDEPVSVRLLDFGLAQFDEAETLTAVGDVPGTLAYISPERLRGEEACAGSDVWAVGILLWEALAGKHPFWGVPLPRMAATIEAGCPPLQPERPDLPKRLLNAVGHALAPDPGRRPPAAALARELRESLTRRPQRSTKIERDTVSQALVRLAPAAGAGVAGVVGGSALPFYPTGGAAAIGVVAAVTALRSPRAALALALAGPVLPLGNHALGLALVYAAVAVAVLAASWREPRAGAVFLAGPALGAVGLAALAPLAVAAAVRGHVARAVQTLAAVAAAAVAAGLRGVELPFAHAVAGPLGLAGEEGVAATARTLADAVPPELGLAAAALAAAAVAIPFARTPWRIAGLGAALLAATLLLAPAAPALPLVLAAWATCVVLAAAPGGLRRAARDA